MPTRFRWLWYLVGLAGMVLTVIGILAILGSAADLGIIVPVTVVAAIVIGYVVIRFRRSIDAALAAAPSRQAGSTPPAGPEPEPEAEPAVTVPAVTVPTSEAEAPGSAAASPAPRKPASGPARTSRR